MSTGGDVSEQIVRDGMIVFEELTKIAGHLTKETIGLIAALINHEGKSNGAAPVTNLKNHALKTGQELQIFPMKKGDIPVFKKLAKEYGVLYHKPIFPPVFLTKDKDTMVDMVALSGDAHAINHIYEKLGYPVPERDDGKNAETRATSGQNSDERGNGYNRSQPNRMNDSPTPLDVDTVDDKLPTSTLGKIQHFKKVSKANAAAKTPKAPVQSGPAR